MTTKFSVEIKKKGIEMKVNIDFNFMTIKRSLNWSYSEFIFKQYYYYNNMFLYFSVSLFRPAIKLTTIDVYKLGFLRIEFGMSDGNNSKYVHSFFLTQIT